MSAGFAYTVGTGRLFMDIAEFHREAETLLDRPILTHEFAGNEVWNELRAELEERLRADVEPVAEEAGKQREEKAKSES